MAGSTDALPGTTSNFFIVAFEEPHKGARALAYDVFHFGDESTEGKDDVFGHGLNGFVFHYIKLRR